MRRHGLRLLGLLVGAVALVVGVWTATMWWQSRLPGSYNVMDYGSVDGGGGPVAAHAHGPDTRAAISVASLTGPGGTPDARYTLTARARTVRLPSGRSVDALTFDGRLPGTELRVHEGDLVEVTLLNADVGAGVTIHWHGVEVPNAEDGVAGVTQDAVAPGGRHVYRFRAERAGTFWYHTHQVSASEVRRGLYGAFVVEPRESPAGPALDLALPAHTFGSAQTLGGSDVLQRRAVAPGTQVRLRLINTDATPRRFTLDGTPFEVVAIDGSDVADPAPLERTVLELAAGGRYDVAFRMPDSPVRLSIPSSDAALLLSPDGRGDIAPSDGSGDEFDPLTYGGAGPAPFGTGSHFDRRFRFSIGRKPGFLDGRPGMQWSINGGVYPDVPVFVVRRGDLVEVTIENHTKSVHPMHLHGHTLLVLDRDGVDASGSPWWTDTLDVEPGERYRVAFRADNPGIWMDHCHNLGHASAGLTMHVAYEGVATPFRTGGATHNQPE